MTGDHLSGTGGILKGNGWGFWRVTPRTNSSESESGFMDDSEWTRKGATLSHKTAKEEFGLTWEEIVEAIRAGKLQCREQAIYGNPWLRLLRREVEALVGKTHGAHYLRNRQTQTELSRINRDLKRLKAQIAQLEERKSKLIACPRPDGADLQSSSKNRASNTRLGSCAGTPSPARSPKRSLDRIL